MNKDLRRLCKKIGYLFNDEKLLKQALTHKSLETKHNERMEFLGDSIVNFIVAELLFSKRPDAREGDLSRRRANLVNREGLADVANDFELSDFLRMGTGELRSGGFRRPSILSDALEAIIGAIYLDSDMKTCGQVVSQWFLARLEIIGDVSSLKDPKTQLQEELQALKFSLPLYKLVEVKGKQHDQSFVVECEVFEKSIKCLGEGNSRRKAEQEAAAACLQELKDDE